MTAAGLRIRNPTTGTLVISSEGIALAYAGQPTLVTAASKSGTYYAPFNVTVGQYTPATYEFTAPNEGIPPVVAAKLSTASIVDIGQPYHVSGTTWRVLVSCFARSGTSDYTAITPATPSLYVFTPFSAAEGASAFVGLRLRNSAGKVAFMTSRKPMWIRQVLTFPAAHAERDSGTWYPSDAGVYGDQLLPWTPISSAILINPAGNGYTEGDKADTGEIIFTGGFGWTLSGTSTSDPNSTGSYYLRRQRYVATQEARYVETADLIYADVGKSSPIIIDGSIL